MKIMYKEMYDSVALFKHQKSFDTFYKNNINFFTETRALNPTNFIYCCFDYYFLEFSKNFAFLNNYANKCHKSFFIHSVFPPPEQYDVLFFPFLYDLLLSSLYTAQYLNSLPYFILVPELLHCKMSKIITAASNAESLKSISIAKVINITNADDITVLSPSHDKYNINNETRKSYYKKFWNQENSKYWEKIYGSKKSNDENCIKYVIPLFQCDFAYDLVFNSKRGIKSKTIDINQYYSSLNNQISIGTSTIEELLYNYKQERIFRMRFMHDLAGSCLGLSEEYWEISNELLDYLSEIILFSLSTDFNQIANILINVKISKEKDAMPFDMSDYLFMTSLSDNESSLFWLEPLIISHSDYLWEFIEMFKEQLENIRRCFFASLFKHFKTYEDMSCAIFDTIKQLDKFPVFNTTKEFYNFKPTFNSFDSSGKKQPESLDIKSQKQLIQVCLKKYWNSFSYTEST